MKALKGLLSNAKDHEEFKVKVVTMLQSNFRRKVAHRKIFKPKNGAKKKKEEARE